MCVYIHIYVYEKYEKRDLFQKIGAIIKLISFINSFSGDPLSVCVCVTGVKTEEIRKGRILVGLRYIWRVFLEIRPLLKSKENVQKPGKKYV